MTPAIKTSRRPARLRPLKITETQEQKTVVAYFRKVGFDGDVIWTHIRGERAGASARFTAWKMGVRSKLPDFLFIWEGHGWIEMKKRGFKAGMAKGNKLNDHEIKQLAMHDRLRALGDWVEICETLDEVKEACWRHGIPLRSESIVEEKLRAGFLAAMEGVAK